MLRYIPELEVFFKFFNRSLFVLFFDFEMEFEYEDDPPPKVLQGSLLS